jgi:plastocyanin
MGLMHPQTQLIRFALPFGVALILSACAGAGPGWTYAPLGPSAPPSPSSGPSAQPSGSGAPALTLEVKTTDAAPLAFEPNELTAPANTVVQVNYLNDTAIQHNIEFFAGADQTAPMLGQTERVTGPGALESVTITTPATPGDYFFWCFVHQQQMTGTLHVTQ